MKKIITATVLLAAIATSASNASAADEIRHYQAAADNAAVWMATNQGLVRYDKSSGETKTFSTDKFTNITSVAISPEGTVTVGAYGTAGIASFDGAEFSAIKCGDFAPQNIDALAFADGLWAGATQMVLHQTADGWKRFEGPSPVSSNFDFHTLAWSQKESKMWFGVQSSTKDNKFGFIDDNGMTIVPATFDVNDLYVQNDGTVVLATEKGMTTYADGKFAILEHPISSIPANCNVVTGRDGELWFAAGNKLVKGIPSESKFIAYTYKSQDGSQDTITDVVLDGDNVWVLLSHDGLKKLVDGSFVAPTLGVEEALAEPETDSNDMYDLQGRRIREAAKGQIYIQGGKKLVGR